MSDVFIERNCARVENALGTAIQDMVYQAPADPLDFLARRLAELARQPPQVDGAAMLTDAAPRMELAGADRPLASVKLAPVS